jgi:hypothetical protein
VFNKKYSSVFCVNKAFHCVHHTVFCVNNWARWEDYLHKILGITLFWTLWEDLFTQNTEEYFMLNTVGRFIYTKYCMLNTVESFIYTKYWGILLVEHCGNIYLHKILGNRLYWTLWEDLFTQNTAPHSVQHKVFLSILCK